MIPSFISRGDDIIVQVLHDGDHYISLDGHTRLYLAVSSLKMPRKTDNGTCRSQGHRHSLWLSLYSKNQDRLI